MKLHVVAVGERMPEWVAAGFAEYARRMPRETPLQLTEIRPESRATGRSVAQMRTAEAERIKAALPSRCFTVALDERGAALTTAQLAQRLEAWMQEGRDVAFVIGGADGLDAELKRSAGMLLALSAFTLPHGLARVLLAEQLYRATTIINHHPYHRE